MKDHEIRETVSRVQELCFQFRDSQQLRERIANYLVPVLKAALPSDAAQAEATHIIIKVKRPEDYEDVDAQIVADDFVETARHRQNAWEWEVVDAAPVPPAAAAPLDQQPAHPKSE